MSEPVKVTLRAGGGGSVWIGDHDISSAVQAINIVGSPRGSRVQLELAVLITTVDGESTIGLPERTEQALVALGWTPPGAEKRSRGYTARDCPPGCAGCAAAGVEP